MTTASELLSAPWDYQLFDDDYGTDDTVTVPLKYQITEDDFVAGKFTVGPLNAMTTMTVQLQKQ